MSKYVKELMMDQLRSDLGGSTSLLILDLKGLDAIAEHKFRNDKGGNVAAPVGKLNFTDAQLIDNINTFLNHLRTVKPATAKGTYIRTVTISATMSPGIRVVA